MSYKIRASDVNRITRGIISSASAAERATYRVINRVAQKTLTASRREIVSQVSLTAAYVRERMDLSLANPGRMFAVITARRRPTRLATYGARQLTRAAKTAKGDVMRSIAAGRKQAGVSVKVKRAGGGRKQMRGAFFIPLRRGRGDLGANGMGVFIRTGTGRDAIKHLYGPSVDQVFRSVADRAVPKVMQELRDELKKQTAYEVRKAIGK